MKVLFVHSGKPDYLQDALYAGLVKVLGAQNILCHRWYKRYHLGVFKYPKNLGFVGFEWPRVIGSGLLREVDVVLLGSCKAATFNAFLKIAPSLRARSRLVLIDGGDDPRVAGDLEREGAFHLLERLCSHKEPDIIFKREMLLDRQYAINVFPLTFSSGLESILLTPGARSIDVAFWAVESHPIRTTVLAALRDKFDCAENGTVQGNSFRTYSLSGARYIEALQRVKISLNYRGAGWDTLRYWEVTALGGFLVSQRPQIHIPNNFENGKSIVFVGEDPGEMLDACHFYLQRPEKRAEIGATARRHCQIFHSKQARATQVMCRVEGLL